MYVVYSCTQRTFHITIKARDLWPTNHKIIAPTHEIIIINYLGHKWSLILFHSSLFWIQTRRFCVSNSAGEPGWSSQLKIVNKVCLDVSDVTLLVNCNNCFSNLSILSMVRLRSLISPRIDSTAIPEALSFITSQNQYYPTLIHRRLISV